MTLPVAPQGWDIDALTVDRTQTIAAFGFTERQARFLVTVMLHSGVFVERQYCAFAGIVHGQKTHDFLERLTTRGMAKAVAVGPLHRGRLFHVHHKPLYARFQSAPQGTIQAYPQDIASGCSALTLRVNGASLNRDHADSLRRRRLEGRRR